MFENVMQKLNISPEAEKIVGVKTRISFLPAFDSLVGFLKERAGGEIVIITSDSGYFSAGRELREALKSAGESVSVFCADDGDVTRTAVKDFSDSVVNAGLAVVIGDAELYKIAAPVLREKELPLAFVPSGCEIGAVFCVCEKKECADFSGENAETEFFCDPDLIVFDGEIIEKNSNKYKNYSACCFSESVRLLDFEVRVLKIIKKSCAPVADSGEKDKEITDDFDFCNVISGLLKSVRAFLQEYYTGRDYKSLFYACILAGITKRCAFLSGVGDAAFVFASVSGGYVRGEKVFGGELELYAARIMLLIYENFLRFKFCKGGNFGFNLPGAFSAALKAEKDLGLRLCDLPNIPHYFYNDGELAKIVDALYLGDETLSAITDLKNDFVKAEIRLKSVYGGKKRAAKSVGEKIKADALYLTPFLTRGDCLLKIVCACGGLEAQSI